ncbi:MAG: tRNA (adenosine(37)-N6)-threonylcarbamoyltransferase complex ATPase subunit type 1 TsaE [Rhizobiales bacterium]|nr:tRNA (adenosine(37)-N6)-threonylcarbamoyltransferase complex ATPase subunit type 1 TsaE [Hyphomicrobiales bacterium]
MRTLELHSEQATAALGAELSLFARPGQVIALKGPLGSGKSVLARGFIHGLAGIGGDFDVPSPTFTLIQAYDSLRVPVVHADLYRLRSESEVIELGLNDLARSYVLLIEWPEYLPSPFSPDCLTIELAGTGNARTATLTSSGTWKNILARNESIAAFLRGSNWAGAQRHFFEGDASSRRYERLQRDSTQSILMDMPARPDGPPVKDGKPYSRIAHLAEDIRSVVAVNDYLVSLGYGAPRVEHADLTTGLAIIEDLGDAVYGRMRSAGLDMRTPMTIAVEVLADMAKRTWPPNVPLRGGGTHALHRYDEDALAIETELLTEWFWPHAIGKPIDAAHLGEFRAIWKKAFAMAATDHPVWVLRDFHSPNLLWLEDRTGLARVGLIDTQDCLIGHPAYDLASLLQDARIDIPVDEHDRLFAYYCKIRGAGFDENAFRRAYAMLGAQRATKILGIFARLSKRDGKHGYLKHIPRVFGYLQRNLAHPDLGALKRWYDANLPANAAQRAA